MDKNIEYKRECLDTSWIAPDCSKRLDQSQCGIRITLPPRDEEQEIKEEEREESQQVWKMIDEFMRKSIWAQKDFSVTVYWNLNIHPNYLPIRYFALAAECQVTMIFANVEDQFCLQLRSWT